ncbi:hypothetical protein HK101_007623 [Irineochytrium annulatum]|nr:hypothetical protein HK101_007623 [Irineochytrium annulatum]
MTPETRGIHLTVLPQTFSTKAISATFLLITSPLFGSHVLNTAAYLKIDPTFAHASDYEHFASSVVGDHTTYRVRPIVNGLRVHAADRVLTQHNPSKRWAVARVGGRLHPCSNGSDAFVLSPTEALRVARLYVPHLSLARSDESRSISEPVYFADHWTRDGELRPAYRIVDGAVPTKDRHVRFIDAQTGDVIATWSTVHYDQGMVFPVGSNNKLKFPQTPPVAPLLDVLSPTTSNGGYSIRGKDFRSFNTCQAYRCANGTGLNGPGSDLLGACDLNGVQCVDVPDNFDPTDPKQLAMLPPNSYVVPWYFTTDGKFIDLDKDWTKAGYPNGVIQMQWADATMFAPRLRQPSNGIWGSDINFSNYTSGEFDDGFAELQAYASMTNHLQFMRNLLNDTSFCLVGYGPNCTQIDPRSNVTSTPFTREMSFVVNYRELGGGDFMGQFGQGLGKNVSNPIVFTGFQAFTDAFFAGSGYQPPLDGSEGWRGNCSDQTCNVINDTPFDFVAFGQGGTDWSLNECIVFHEAVHCGISDFRLTYNGHPFRNLNNDLDCTACVGEIHADGQIFSGGLWALRKRLGPASQSVYDTMILHAMSLGQPTDTFATQFTLILRLIQTHTDPAISALYPTALAEFGKRELNCSRSTVYSETMDSSFQLPTAHLTSANLSTTPNQMIIELRASDWGFMLSWQQWYLSPILGPLSIGYGKSRIQFVVSYDCPVIIQGSKASWSGYSACPGQDPVLLPWILADIDVIKQGFGSVIKTFPAGSVKKIYVWLGHNVPAQMTLYSTYLTLFGWVRVFYLTITGMALAASGVGLFCAIYMSATMAIKLCAWGPQTTKSFPTPDVHSANATATDGAQTELRTLPARRKAGANDQEAPAVPLSGGGFMESNSNNGDGGSTNAPSSSPIIDLGNSSGNQKASEGGHSRGCGTNVRGVMLAHVWVTSLVFAGVGVAGILAIIYPPSRKLAILYAFLGLIFIQLIDISRAIWRGQIGGWDP